MSRFLASAACCVLFKSHIWCVEALRPASWWLDLLSRSACGLLAGAGLFPYFFSEVSRVPGFGVGMMLAWCGASAVTRGGRISFGTDWDVLAVMFVFVVLRCDGVSCFVMCVRACFFRAPFSSTVFTYHFLLRTLVLLSIVRALPVSFACLTGACLWLNLVGLSRVHVLGVPVLDGCNDSCLPLPVMHRLCFGTPLFSYLVVMRQHFPLGSPGALTVHG